MRSLKELTQKRLLPAFLAICILFGVIPIAAVSASASDAALQKLTTTATAITYKGNVGTGRSASLLVDGNKASGGSDYFVVGNDQMQQSNSSNPENPAYWLQMDLGKEYSISQINLWVYYGRALKNLVILASNNSNFAPGSYYVIWNADQTEPNGFFGLGKGTDPQFENATAAGDTITLTEAVNARYLRFFNNGHTDGAGQGAHWLEIEVYGEDTTTPALYNVALKKPVTVNHGGSVDSARPASLITDGLYNDNNSGYTEVNRDGSQTGQDPSYAQIDLQDEYPICRLNFWNYWERTVNGLVIMLSTDPTFPEGNRTFAFNSDKNNYFGFGSENAKSNDPVFTDVGIEIPLDSPITARYIRIMNVGHSGTESGGHYIELQAWSTQAPTYTLRDALDIPTYEHEVQSGERAKQDLSVTHPDVIDFGNENSWGGYRYWMALTPNQEGYSQYENPCLAASTDGLTWTVPDGLTNPLTGVEHEPANTHNCDTDLVYNETSDELWIYYIWEKDSPRGTPSELRRIKVGYNAASSTYSVGDYELCIQSDYQYDMQSPAIVRRSDDKWLMWSNNSDQNDGIAGWQNPNGFVEFRTSTDGKTWSQKTSLKQSLILRGEGSVEYYIPWHLDVKWIDSLSEYWAIICAYPKGGDTRNTYLLFARSENGVTWTTYPKPIISPRTGAWDQNFIYRSTFTYEPATSNRSDKLRIWYSGGKESSSLRWRIGYYEIDDFVNQRDTALTWGEPYVPQTPQPIIGGSWIDVTPGSGNIMFDENWEIGEDTDAYSYKKGSTATLCFYGTGVRWIGQKERCFGEANVYLDGVEQANVNSQYVLSGNLQNQTIFEISGLALGTHVLTIEPKKEGKRQGLFPHDGVQITKLQTFVPQGDIPNGIGDISLSKQEIAVGETAQIVILSPFNATSHAVEYSPANGEYASVSQNGIVSGIRPGVQHLTVTAGSDMRTISITVTEPSGNWVQVDSHSDRIIYSGSWTDNSETACINGLSKQTDDRYATADFTFIGTGCRWIGQMDSNYGSAILSVDGKPFAYVNASVSAGPQYQQTIFQINGLPSGEHTIRVSAQDTWIEVDAFEYYVGSDPLSGAVNHLDIHPGVILLDSGESVTIVATAMQASRIAVYTDALSFAVENEQIATLSQNTEDGSMILTGVAPGETLLTASLAGTSVINAKKISILQNGIQQIARMPVNEENPLLLVSIYAQTKNTEWMTDPTGQTVPKGVPAQGNLTVTGVWDMIPDDLKPHTAIQLHGDDFVGHGYGGNGDHDALWAWYGYFVDQAEEYNRNEPDTSKHINLYLTLMTGGTPISVLNRTVPDDELTQFIAEHDCIKGVVLSENHNNSDTVAVAEVSTKYLKMMAQQGCYLVLTDIDRPGANMMEKWFNDTDTLYNAAKKYHQYLIINSKSTTSSGFNTVRSFALGAWLGGLADNWGALTDAWTWYETGYHRIFSGTNKVTYEDVRRVYTFPETLFAMNMLQCYANGAVVFNAEHPFYCTGVNDKASWALKESILPAFRYITENPAASRDAVAAEIKAGIFTSNKTYLPQNYAAGLYGNASDTNILQYSGRYRVLPLFTNRVQESDVPAHIWNNKLYVSDFNGKTDAYKQGKLNPLYPEVSTGDAFVETLLGGNERWLVMNSSFNDNTNQTAGIIPATAAFASSMNFTLTPHTYLVVEQDTDSLSIELNNFRTDKDELWVAGKSSNPDWTSYGTDWNGDNKLYVQEYMNYHIDNPKLDKRDTERYDLRDTVISLSVSNQPTLSIEFIGSGSTQHTYTESYVDGIYTLTITHNGRVKVTLT